mgnify:CR=1 FL=1
MPVADMMTDKATVEMESPVSGVVVELAGEVGLDEVPAALERIRGGGNRGRTLVRVRNH